MQVGTTVSIRLLFNRFPVRRTELKAHSKREFSHALNVIQSFAIISRQIQHFQVFSSSDNHPPTNALLTLTPANSMKDTLGQIFGQKILQSIIHIDDDEDENRQFKVIRLVHPWKCFSFSLVRWIYLSTSTWFRSFIE